MHAMGIRRYRPSGCRISDEFTYRGLRVCVLENELLRISVLVDQGTDIFEFQYKPQGIDLLWGSPRGVTPRATFIESMPASDGSFSDFYEGGWQECFPNGGRVCEYKGADLALHGEVYGLPWDCRIIEDTPTSVSARFQVRTYRTPFLLTKTLTLRAATPVLEIHEAVTNECGETMDCMWGHHPAFGAPFLSGACVVTTGAQNAVVHDGHDPQSRFEAPLVGTFPRLQGRDGQLVDVGRIPDRDNVVSDMLYLTELEEGWYAITNTDLGLGFFMAFDSSVFKHIWYWIACNAPAGSPFFGRSYAVALEPFTSFPAILTKAIDAGRQLTLGPFETLETRLQAGVFEGSVPPRHQSQLPIGLP
jgi:hypothetical protein